jgi:hypothetical protein
VHEAFAVALAGVLGQHLAEVFQSPRCHMLDHLVVQALQEGAPDLERVFGARPFCAKRWLSEPLAKKATVPS